MRNVFLSNHIDQDYSWMYKTEKSAIARIWQTQNKQMNTTIYSWAWAHTFNLIY